ncbi:MAG: putative toxin-antitoxin system toxin component, PIN family [Thermomicrobiales bacterium]|nr:putative toxin-antitoxin system toxin component, PIN family [Thermomicrobiales bacterium]
MSQFAGKSKKRAIQRKKSISGSMTLSQSTERNVWLFETASLSRWKTLQSTVARRNAAAMTEQPVRSSARGGDSDIVVVIDTVGFLRALISPGGPWGEIVFDHAGLYTLIVSDELIRECTGVFRRPELARRLSTLQGRNLETVEGLLRRGTRVILKEVPRASRDSSDDYLIEMARIGRARYVATEDKDLLSIGVLDDILFVTGRTFLEVLREH